MHTTLPDEGARARRYANRKYAFLILEAVGGFCLLFLFAASGMSKALAGWVGGFAASPFQYIPLYLFIFLCGYSLILLPLSFYRTYWLERTFSLTKQRTAGWFLDQCKSGLIGYIIALILVGAFYYIWGACGGLWWVVVSLFWIGFNLVLAKLVPVLIIPLFFKYRRLEDPALKDKIYALASAMGVKLIDVFEIDFSKKTLKANAAFVGWGRTRRVLLADTLRGKYSHDEIAAILAHEFAHYKLKHLLKLVCINSASAFILFYLIDVSSGSALSFFGFSSLGDVAALPVLFMYVTLLGFVLTPFENYISRVFEKNADMLALRITGSPEAFVSMMEKLASQNLADRKPSLLAKVFFFDHPPIEERIALAHRKE